MKRDTLVRRLQKRYFEPVSTLVEIEAAITKLPTHELLKVAAWLDDYRVMIQTSEALFESLDAEELDAAGPQWLGE